MKCEDLQLRLEGGQAYLDQVEMSLAAAAAAAAAHHHNTTGLRHPRSRHTELENIHKGTKKRIIFPIRSSFDFKVILSRCISFAS